MPRAPLFLMIFIAAATSAFAQNIPGTPLSGLEVLRDQTTLRSSSSDADWRNGNGDARYIPAGETLTLCELSGPGVISHIWFTVAHNAQWYSRLLTLRMYWDGEEHPSVEAPLGDFFVIGHGVDRPFSSLPVRVSSDGRARNCYWPMPFRQSARITVTNESDQPCGAFFWYIDWQKPLSLPESTAYFHAMYRQEFPCVMGRNYLLADIQGRGHYVGTVQSVCHVSEGWYGEGDDFFFIDGETEPSLRGTGTEDYFCDAWGFREFDGPYYGIPLWEGYAPGDRGTAYRWHLGDAISFKTSLRAEIEHKGSQNFPDNTWSGFIERDDLMSSVAYWYQTEPHKPWPALPPGPGRLPFTDQTIAVGYQLLADVTHSEHPLVIQDLPGMATDGKQLFFLPREDTGWLEIPFTLAQDIEALLVGKFTHSWDYGTYRALLDGRELEVMDLYNPAPTPREHRWGMHKLSAGQHILRFECVGKPGKSTGYFLGFDALVARVPSYTRPPETDLRDLQVAQ